MEGGVLLVVALLSPGGREAAMMLLLRAWCTDKVKQGRKEDWDRDGEFTYWLSALFFLPSIPKQLD